MDSFALAILYHKALFLILDRSVSSSPSPPPEMTVHFVSCQYFVLTVIKLFVKFDPHVSLLKSFICGFVCVRVSCFCFTPLV